MAQVGGKERRFSSRFSSRFYVAAGLVVAVCVVALVCLVYGLGPRNWGVVEQGRIYRSGLMRPWQVHDVLDEHDVKVIVSMCTRDTDDPRDNAQEAAAQELGIEVKRFPMNGNGTTADGTMDMHVDALEAIVEARKAGKPVLVQCSAGAQRTGGVVAAYQLLIERRNPDEVMAELRRHKHDPADNTDLLPFLNRNLRDAARKLVARGIIPDLPPVLRLGDSAEAAPDEAATPAAADP